MKVQLKKLIKELLPPFAFRAVQYLNNANATPPVVDEDISGLKEKFKLKLSEESIIIGNGPSLKHTLSNHLDFFQGKTVFCVNSFVESEYFEAIQPTFYVLADLIYWDRGCTPKRHAEYVEVVYRLLVQKVKKPMFLLLPIAARDWNWFQNMPKENPNITLAYFNNASISDSADVRHPLYLKNVAMPHVQTVLVAAVFFSLNLGFKKSYLVGADLSFTETIFVNKDNMVCIVDKHFYDKNDPAPIPFWSLPDESGIFKMDELLLAFSLMFKGFLELEAYAKFLNVKVYNASHKSYIDAFERYDLET